MNNVLNGVLIANSSITLAKCLPLSRNSPRLSIISSLLPQTWSLSSLIREGWRGFGRVLRGFWKWRMVSHYLARSCLIYRRFACLTFHIFRNPKSTIAILETIRIHSLILILKWLWALVLFLSEPMELVSFYLLKCFIFALLTTARIWQQSIAWQYQSIATQVKQP